MNNYMKYNFAANSMSVHKSLSTNRCSSWSITNHVNSSEVCRIGHCDSVTLFWHRQKNSYVVSFLPVKNSHVIYKLNNCKRELETNKSAMERQKVMMPEVISKLNVNGLQKK